MNCPICQFENLDSAKYCSNCGASLSLTCTNCGHKNQPGSKFCNNCGNKIDGGQDLSPKSAELPLLERLIPVELAAKVAAASSGNALDGERRVATILFCDILGSTNASGQMDPEEWAEIMNGAFEHMIQPVYKYEGIVARLMGDAILAFFGAPIAHEDDPQRAVLAGLEITEGINTYSDDLFNEKGLRLNSRVGINTGLVVVGAIGSDLRMEYTAMGDAINLAARMEQTAQPGSVQISTETQKLVAPFFKFKSLGMIHVKGKDQPVEAYSVLEPKGTVGRLRGIEGLEAPLIGREKEFEQLQERINDLQLGLGGVVCLVGEAGLGKSRLISELKSQSLTSSSIQIYETSSLSYESRQPYGLFRHLFRQLINAGNDDNPQILREKINILAKEVPLEGRGQFRRVIETLFNLDADSDQPTLEGEAFKGLLYTSMASFWRHKASEKPVVMIFDDLHWSDPASIGLILRLLPLIDQLPLLLLCAMRPDRDSPGWQVRQIAESDFLHRYIEIKLQPLTSHDSAELVDRLLAISDFPPNILSRILEKAEGNPLFIEEVVRTLIDQGFVTPSENGSRWISNNLENQIDIPDNLQTLLLTRIDSLEESARWVLQLAAVIGRTFFYRVLARLVDATQGLDEQLLNLQRQQMIQETARVPELEYIFKHVLVQEVAYGTILLRKKKDFHFEVGEALEQLYPDQTNEYAPFLAHHFDLAGETKRALKYYRLAGDAAFRLHAAGEAIDHYSNALKILRNRDSVQNQNATGDQAELLMHLYLRRGRAFELNQQFEEAAANYSEMETLANDLDDPNLFLASLVAVLTLHSIPGPQFDLQQATSLANQALSLANQLNDQVSESKIYWNLTILNTMTHQSSQAIDYAQRSIAIARELNLEEQLAYSLNDLARALLGNGDFERAKIVSHEAQALFKKMGDLPMVADNILNAAERNLILGNYERSYDQYKQIADIATSIDNQWLLAWGLAGMGYIALDYGQVSKGIEMISETIRIVDRIGIDLLAAGSRAHLAYLYTTLGDQARGRELADEALAITQSANFPQHFLTWPSATIARVWCHLGELDKSKSMLETSSQYYDPDDYIILYLKQVSFADADLALASGNPQRAKEIMDELISQLREKKVRSLLPEALRIKGQALLLNNQQDDAFNSFQEARLEAEVLGERKEYWKILSELAKLENQKGNIPQADLLRHQAKEVVTYISDHIDDQELRTSFLELKEIRELL